MASTFSLLDKQAEALDKYLQVGAGSVTGTVNGQSISESFGSIRLKMPVERLFPWSPKYIDVSSTWHNGEYTGGVTSLNSDSLDMSLETLFILHDYYKTSIIGNNLFSGGYLINY